MNQRQAIDLGNPAAPSARPGAARILIVDDDPGLLRLLTIRLRAENYNVEAVDNGPAALAAAARFRPDLVISDLRMEPMDGISLLKEMQARWPGLKVILLTAHGSIPDAVEATQKGAFSFLTKPVEKTELLAHVEKALRVSGFAAANEDWRADIVTRSPLMEEKLALAHMVAGTETRVLITGESGAGKELLARAIHKASPRRAGPFVLVNCGALKEDTLELELFGNRPNDADPQLGAFRNADGGTLLLDDVTEMPSKLQVKLLRVLHENAVRPVGATDAVPVNVRVLASSQRDLPAAIAAGQFREDLYYRLNVVHIDLPPLAKRREDIPLLVAHFLTGIARESGTRRIFAPEAIELLATANWPGNVRQLENAVRQAVSMAHAPVIPAEILQNALGGNAKRLASFDDARDEFTRNYLAQLLQITGGNVSHAARLAKRNRTDFYKLLGRHQLLPDDFKGKI